MSTATDRDIPITDRNWRERWAAELTRANALERELIQTRAARDAARKTCDDLTEHCDTQGAYIARVSAERDEARAKLVELRSALDPGGRAKASMLSEIRDLREMLVEVLRSDVVGMDCDTCGGSGKVRDERDCFSDRIGHFTQPGDEYDCEDCFGGRVAK